MEVIGLFLKGSTKVILQVPEIVPDYHGLPEMKYPERETERLYLHLNGMLGL